MPRTYNVDALIEELELDQEDIVELLTDFREFIEETVPQLEAALASDDLDQSRSLAHSIKGSAGNLRVQEVYGTSKEMQDLADAKDMAGLKALMPKLKAEVEDFMQESADI